MLAFVPAQVERISDLRDSIEAQDRLGDDLHDLADSVTLDPECGPVTVPDERAIPFLALWLGRTLRLSWSPATPQPRKRIRVTCS